MCIKVPICEYFMKEKLDIMLTSLFEWICNHIYRHYINQHKKARKKFLRFPYAKQSDTSKIKLQSKTKCAK